MVSGFNRQGTEDVLAMVEVLEMTGPGLSRPYTDTLKGTRKVKNLKELIIQHAGNPYRVFMPLIRSGALSCYVVVVKVVKG